MQDWTEIRRKVLVEGVAKRSVCKQFGLGWDTLEKILSNAEPPGYRQTIVRTKTKLGPFIKVIEEILSSDEDVPKKQRHTSKRIFERLRDEHGYTGGITQVKEAVSRRKRHQQEVFMPIDHEPGKAQFDFGNAIAQIAGVERKAAFAVMTLPYSDAFFVAAYPRENTESFQAAHVDAFDFFGAVPTKIDYDNSKIAVSKIVGQGRDLTHEFLRLESHHLFDHHFCNVGRGNEKGNVEGLIGYSRRNFMVPIPRCESFADLNAHLAQRCREDLSRVLRGNIQTKAELLEVDRDAMLPIPALAFEPRRVVKTRANSLSLVRFDRNDYSVPTVFAHHEVTVIGGIEKVRIASCAELAASHERIWDKEQISFNPLHYLALLERKPGALDVAKPLAEWKLPECFDLLRRRLGADAGHLGTREYIKVLRLMENASMHDLACAVRQALSIGATTSDAIALILHHRTEKPVSLFSLDGHPHLKRYGIEDLDLGAYNFLKGA